MASLSWLVHAAMHAAHDEMLLLERECRSMASDFRRKKAIRAYLDRQRHRVLQLLGILQWVDSDAAVLRLARESIGAPVEQGLARLHGALSALRDSSRVAHEAKAPRFHLQGALDALCRGTASLPLVVAALAKDGLDAVTELPVTPQDEAMRTQRVYHKLLMTFSYEWKPVQVHQGCLVLSLPHAYSLWVTIDRNDGPWLAEKVQVLVRGKGDAAPWMSKEAEPGLLFSLEQECSKGLTGARKMLHRFAATLAVQVLLSCCNSPATLLEGGEVLMLPLWPERAFRLAVRPSLVDLSALLVAELDFGSSELPRVELDSRELLIPDELSFDGIVAVARRRATEAILLDLSRALKSVATVMVGDKLHIALGTHGGRLEVAVHQGSGKLVLNIITKAKTWGPVPVAERLAKGAQTADEVRLLAEEAAAWDDLANIDAGGAQVSLVAPLPSLVDGLEPVAYAWLGQHEASEYWLWVSMQGRQKCLRTVEGKLVESVSGGYEQVPGMRLKAATIALAQWHPTVAPDDISIDGGLRVRLLNRFALVSTTEGVVEAECPPSEDLSVTVARLFRTRRVLAALQTSDLPEGVSRPSPQKLCIDGAATMTFFPGRAPEVEPRPMTNLALVWDWWTSGEGAVESLVPRGLTLLRDCYRVVESARQRFPKSHIANSRRDVIHVLPNEDAYGAFDIVLNGEGGLTVRVFSSRMFPGVAGARTVANLVAVLAPS